MTGSWKQVLAMVFRWVSSIAILENFPIPVVDDTSWHGIEMLESKSWQGFPGIIVSLEIMVSKMKADTMMAMLEIDNALKQKEEKCLRIPSLEI